MILLYLSCNRQHHVCFANESFKAQSWKSLFHGSLSTFAYHTISPSIQNYTIQSTRSNPFSPSPIDDMKIICGCWAMNAVVRTLAQPVCVCMTKKIYLHIVLTHQMTHIAPWSDSAPIFMKYDYNLASLLLAVTEIVRVWLKIRNSSSLRYLLTLCKILRTLSRYTVV